VAVPESKDATLDTGAETAARIGGQLLATKVIQLESPLGEATMKWCLAHLGGQR
jgi:hypothetical protein